MKTRKLRVNDARGPEETTFRTGGERLFPAFCRFWLLLLPLCGFLPAQQAMPRTAHFEARKHLSEYHGPGRETPDPESLLEIRIGYFGPSEPDHPQGGDSWLAANLAIEDVNAEGGHHGRPFRLIPHWSRNSWGTGISQLTKMVYQDQVWAIIGGLDGASAHLAEQVVAKARLALLNPGSSDKTINLANVPWMFSCLPGEHLQVPVLADEILDGGDPTSLTILSVKDRDSRVFTREFSRHLSAQRNSVSFHYVLDPGDPGVVPLLKSVNPRATVLLVGGPLDSAQLVRQLRETGFPGRIFGTASMGSRTFLSSGGRWVEGVIFPDLTDRSPQFDRKFQQRFARTPDYLAHQTYDAVHLLADSIRRSGLNRTRIRDALRELSPWVGVAGVIEWDPAGQNSRKVKLATVRNGRIEPWKPDPEASP